MKVLILRKNLAKLLCFILIFTLSAASFGANAQSSGGTAENGLNTELTACYSTENTELPVNLDFSSGFKYWALKNDSYGKSTDDGALKVSKISDIAAVTEGIVTFKAFAAEEPQNLGIQ